MPFNPLKCSMCFSDAKKISEISSWHEHIPFAFTIVQLLEPKVIVELGTHKGDSYCAFCQAVDELKLDTACYAVDTWEGDEHSGLYGQEVLEELRTYHDPLYGKFSRLIQSRFDEALNYFSDGSIDLLHIDGLHTYDAVKHDFENWLPKMSRHGVVLIHDTNVKERGFGVWLLWQELKDKYPSFEFKYGHGLGVLAVGENVSSEVLDFIALANTKNVVISDFFSYMGNKISLQYKIQEQSANIFDLEELIEAKDTQIAEIYSEMQDRDTQIAELNGALQNKNIQIAELNGTLNSINQSITWRLVLKYQKVIDKLLPHGKRRRWYERGIHILKVIANDGIKQAIYEIKEYLRINKKIKTTDFRDHSIESISEYVPISETHIDFTEDDIKLIAFYLPQYHPIPENDKFWGKGFTDWRNVAKAIPQFKDHYQPKLPDELGFYDLRIFDVLKRQTELAKQYGVNGFCFHYYWFNGKKLLEKPLNQFLAHPEINFNFCICWANENWTRRWDGLENEILIAQTHSIENDIAFIKDMEPLFRDPRYIRIDGKPVLIVYRITLLPDPKKTAELWREYCIEQGIGEIYLVAAQGFGFSDPRPYGFDAAVEFPPHTMHDTKKITNKMKISNPKFTGSILDYEEFVKSETYLQPQEYKLYRTVSPGWDNTARRLNNATIFFGSNPKIYKEWLSNVARLFKNVHTKDERIIFINAWNEWAEGAYLEPDMKYGYGYLQATSEVIQDCRSDKIEKWREDRKIIFVSHDAHCHGAQMIALNIVKMLKTIFHYDVYLILKSGGQLDREFREYSTIFNLESDFKSQTTVEELIATLRNKGADIAICNTVISGDLVELFHKHNIKTLSLIHELPGVIQQYNMEDNANIIAQYADTIIFPSEFVKSKFATVVKLDDNKCTTAPQGIYLKNEYKDKKEDARLSLRELLSIPSDSKIVLGVGYADFRKGPDLFTQIGKEIVESDSEIYFIWVGNEDKTFTKNIISDIKKSGFENNIRFVGFRKDMDIFYSGADLYLLTSREDPFPSTVLEAMDAGVPVIGFEDAGGFEDIVTENTGILVPYLDVDEMTKAVTLFLNDHSLRKKMGRNASDLVSKKYNYVDYVYLLLKLLGHEYKKVSVVIPSYNYGRYLDERFDTIANQTYPIYEIIFLDDCSSDNSIEIAKKYTSNCRIPTRIILNDVNSGSVFKQWKKGIEISRGDYVWIAEADDFCDKLFLEHLIPSLYDPEVVLAYSQSAPVNEKGRLYMPDYQPYTANLSETRWNSAYTNNGIDEIRDYLSIKNTIPNASAVVFRREGVTMPDGIQDFRFAGDWLFYMNLLQKGKIAFVPEVLNFHRRHGKTVTNKMELDEKAIIEQLQVKIWILEQIKLPATRIAPCVAHVISEYYRLSELHNLSRPSFMKNPVLKPWIDRLQELVSDALMKKHNHKSLLIVIGDAEVGGGQIAAVRLANQWSKHHRVFLCNARPEALDKVLVDLIDPDVIFLEGAPGQSEWSKGERPVEHLNSRISETHLRVAVVRDLIEFYGIDIIMSHIWWADRFVYAINKELQIPWFIQMHGCYEALISHPEWDSKFTKLAPEIIRLAAGVCYLSSKNLLIFDKGLVPKPAFLREFDNALESASIPDSVNDHFARGADDFVFCLCTRAIPEKGWEEAIKSTLEINALPTEVRKGKRARLLLIGEGEYKRTLQTKYAGHEDIEFMGRVPDQFSVIHTCDVGLLPSRFVSESKPLTVIEYLACSKPVIATTMGSIPEMIAWDDREAGLLIRHDLKQKLFVDALREAMLHYMRNQTLVEEHKHNARTIFDAQFDLEKVAQQYLTFFSEAISNGEIHNGRE